MNEIKETISSIYSVLFKALLQREIQTENLTRYMQSFNSEKAVDSFTYVLNELLSSTEHRNKSIINNIVNSNFYKFTYTEPTRSSNELEILILQTSDADNYIPIIQESSNPNKKYAKKIGAKYEKYLGIKRGCYPHHATYNRIHLLKELVDNNYKGWILYLDADALIADHQIDLRKYLIELQNKGKSVNFHSAVPIDVKINHWDINAGVFAINLDTDFSKRLINCWYQFYEVSYTDQHYIDATQWDSILNDQTSLHNILRSLGEKLTLENIEVNRFLQETLCRQFIRDDFTEMPAHESILLRAKKIKEFAIAAKL
jgi:hypothetical protein